MTTHPSWTTVPARISLSSLEPNAWAVKCDNCKHLVRGPIQLLGIGHTAFELCVECVEELKAAIAVK